MFRKAYARWMYRWETRLTTRDENRVVRPLDWGFEWIAPFLEAHGLGAAELRQLESPGGGGVAAFHPSGAKAPMHTAGSHVRAEAHTLQNTNHHADGGAAGVGRDLAVGGDLAVGRNVADGSDFADGDHPAAAIDDATAEAVMTRINQILIRHSSTFFGYERPTDFRLEERHPQLFPTNVRPETLAKEAELRQRAEEGLVPRAQFLRFTSPERTRHPENDLVNARWFPAPAHKDPARPKQAIIVLPQWNADAFSHNALCTMFNRMGISALRLSKPYHDIRRPTELERSDYAVSANIGRTLSACRQAVVDIRCCLDWLEEQGYEHFGVLGTSLGSCYAFLASAHDARLRVNAFNHASTSFGDVVWAGQSTLHIREALAETGLTQERLRALWAAISPVNYYDKFAGAAAAGPDKNVLVVYADYDLTFPREYSLQVIDAFRRSGLSFEPRVLPCGHYTTGETPYKFIDGWYLGSFVYRAFKALRAEKAAGRAAPMVAEREAEEEAISR